VLTEVCAVFGLMVDRYAGETRAGEPFGTTPYMAPELCEITEEITTYELVGNTFSNSFFFFFFFFFFCFMNVDCHGG
jgi:hypothetical protein